MKIPTYLSGLLVLAIAIPMMFCSAHAEEVVSSTDTTESINRILRQIEEMAGVLALNETLNAEQTSGLLSDLTELHNDVKILQHATELLLQLASQAVRDNAVEEPPVTASPAAATETAQTAPTEAAPTEAAPTEAVPAEAAPAPTEAVPTETEPTEAAPTETEPTEAAPTEADPALTPADEGTTPPEREYDKLVPFLDFDREVSSESVQYNGWLKDSSIDLRWSEQGQIVLEISNGYSTTWTIRERYVGNPHATVTTNSNGLITLQVRDEDGVREYEIRNGGLGPIFRRWIRETEVSGDPA